MNTNISVSKLPQNISQCSAPFFSGYKVFYIMFLNINVFCYYCCLKLTWLISLLH